MRNLKLLLMVCAFFLLFSCTEKPSTPVKESKTAARIEPDYQNIVIPPNIAPLNFKIKNKGTAYYVEIYSENSDKIVISSKDGIVQIPISHWKSLLNVHAGQSLIIDIYSKHDGSWQKHPSIINTIATEPIDSHMAYRLINPAFKYWDEMGLYQRNLETFQEKPILINRMTEGNCMNCHNFCQGDPNNMVFHMRAGKAGGTYLRHNGEWTKLNLKTEFNAGGAYPAWHPNGNLVAFSVNSLTMFYHSRGESRDVLDRVSNVVVYDVEKNMITAGDAISDDHRMETFPCWGPEGKYLYFCSSPNLEEFIVDGGRDLRYDDILYDLNRVSYDAESDTWGELEILIDAATVNKSSIIPRVSPDGKYVLISMSNYGSFPIYHKVGDLYFYHIETGELERLDNVNSETTDSFHSWSSNGRWFVFSSKRRDGFYTRPFFVHVDENGQTSKPFILPQKHPEFYDSFLINYNVPEIFKSEIDTTPQQLVKLAYDNDSVLRAKLDPKLKGRSNQEEQLESIYEIKPN